VLATIVAITAPLVAATHLPSMTGNVPNAEAKKRAAEYQRKLAEAGYPVTLEEAEIILQDALSQGDSQQTLDELKRALEALTPRSSSSRTRSDPAPWAHVMGEKRRPYNP
jgi:hypothetical protein